MFTVAIIIETYPVIFVVVLVTTLDNVDGYRAGDGADVGG
jgi:hypothetical protein